MRRVVTQIHVPRKKALLLGLKGEGRSCQSRLEHLRVQQVSQLLHVFYCRMTTWFSHELPLNELVSFYLKRTRLEEEKTFKIQSDNVFPFRNDTHKCPQLITLSNCTAKTK